MDKGLHIPKEIFCRRCAMLAVLREIKKVFVTGEPSEKVFKKNINYINKLSCKACHLVHQSVAAIQQSWKQKNQSAP
jgi:hypothetical protein